MNLVDTTVLVKKYGITRQAISCWRANGLKYTKVSNNTFLYDLDDVEQYLKNKGSQRAQQEEIG